MLHSCLTGFWICDYFNINKYPNWGFNYTNYYQLFGSFFWLFVITSFRGLNCSRQFRCTFLIINLVGTKSWTMQLSFLFQDSIVILKLSKYAHTLMFVIQNTLTAIGLWLLSLYTEGHFVINLKYFFSNYTMNTI